MKELQFREKYQSCPYCHESHPVRLAGVIKSIHNKHEITQEAGFSFCNCKNIFFTDKRNLDKNVYDGTYFDKYSGSEPMFEKLFEEIIPHVSIIHGSKFVEVGPMNHSILNKAEQNSYLPIAVDINPSIEDKFKNFVLLDLDQLYCKSESNKFPNECGLIWCTHVLEHLQDPLLTMKIFHDKLMADGQVFIAMPDPFFIDWAKAYDWGHWWVREHHTLWDRDTFIKECEKIGFECIYKKRNGAGMFVCNNDFHVILRKKGFE